ncbi:AraC family transcriptional regulator [Rhizobium sp. 2MFCol3.1]|uniref:AraC family transcriptional regulator n=1 Tax=Rhizobium sp. 2MFCol3.1 TaxID=1246459 RepID=UPI00035C5099|nr:AraC family transcriptional regulator [Rhizobium sp. 2MFCol3.1]
MTTIFENDLSENVLSIERRSRIWNGAIVEDIHEHAAGRVLHTMPHANETRFTVSLAEVGSTTECRLKPDKANPVEHSTNHMAVISRGLPWWGYSSQLHYARYAMIVFDIPILEARLQGDFRPAIFEQPRLRFNDPRILSLVKMLLDIPDIGASYSLLGDSLVAGVLALLSAIPLTERQSMKLAPWQVRRVKDYMLSRLPQSIELAELAALLGQSQWHFCRAFKASTGISPYQWQLEEKIKMVRGLLLKSDAPLDPIAEATGFSDAMHLIRAFKKRTGQTPAAWRRENSFR